MYQSLMSYKDFQLEDALERFQLRLSERPLFREVAPREPSAWLAEALREGAPLALTLSNEKARSELIIAPVLLEVRRVLLHKVSLFTGVGHASPVSSIARHAPPRKRHARSAVSAAM